MRKIFFKLTYFFVVITLVSCSNDEFNYSIVSGKVIDKNIENGIPNLELKIISKVYRGSYYRYSEDIDEKYIKTDENGNFSVSIKTEIDGRIEINAYNGSEYSEHYKTYYLSEVLNVIIELQKFQEFKIIIKNVNPFDNHDYISVSPENGVIKRINFGSVNEKIEISPGNYQYVNTWKGTNVHSEIIYKVVPNQEIFIVIYKRKNGINTTLFDDLTILPNQIIEYTINY